MNLIGKLFGSKERALRDAHELGRQFASDISSRREIFRREVVEPIYKESYEIFADRMTHQKDGSAEAVVREFAVYLSWLEDSKDELTSKSSPFIDLDRERATIIGVENILVDSYRSDIAQAAAERVTSALEVVAPLINVYAERGDQVPAELQTLAAELTAGLIEEAMAYQHKAGAA